MRVAVFLVVIAVLGLAVGATDDRYKVIVHPDNPRSAVDENFVRRAFLKKTTDWSDGRTVRPIGLSSRFPARARFAREVLEKTPAQLKRYWSQQIFSGKGVPPPEADSVSDVVAFVLANPGALGYVPASADVGKARVVELR